MRNSVIFLFICIQIFVGCSAPPETGRIVSLSMEVLNPTTDGISVVSFEIHPTELNLQEKLQQFGESIGQEQLQTKLLQEGIQLRRVSAIDVPAIVASIGEVLDESYVWHGQILKWRDLHQRRINPNGMLISEQGTQYFIEEGTLSLMSRSWLIEREDGLHMYLQFLPTWNVHGEKSPIFGKSKRHLRSKVFSELEFETLLRDDEAIIVAVELRAPELTSGPHDDGLPAVRLGEALLGGPVRRDTVQILVIEANIMPRG